MIPQPDPHVLQSNPQFELLYRDLQKNKLHANGSSRIRDDKVLKEKLGFQEVCGVCFSFACSFVVFSSLSFCGRRSCGLG